jgi:hypothetical protein
MISVILASSRPMSNVCLHYVSACIQTSGSILCDPKESSPCSTCQRAPRQEVLYTVNSNLLNNATHKVLKFVDHKYIYYLTSHTCFGPLCYHQVYHSGAPEMSSRFLHTCNCNRKISTIHSIAIKKIVKISPHVILC